MTPVKPTKRPSIQYYPGDWRRDTAIQSCSLTARGLWHEMNCIMHDGEPYGHLAVEGVALTEEQIVRLAGTSMAEYRKALKELDRAGVPSRTEDGIIFSRRMVRDEETRRKRAEGGAMSVAHPNTQKPKGYVEGYPSTVPSPTPIDPPPAVASAVAVAFPPSKEGGKNRKGAVEAAGDVAGRILQRHQPERAAS